VRDAGRKVFDNVPRHAEIVLEQAGHMEALASGLVEFSRAELSIERVNLNSLLERSVEFVRAQARFNGVEWDLALGAPLPELMADPGQLHQVFLNLFLNAADAMKEAGSPRKVIRVAGSSDERARVIRIDVSDTGPGIPPENRARIFEPSFTTKRGGHGFGLSTSGPALGIDDTTSRALASSPGETTELVSTDGDVIVVTPVRPRKRAAKLGSALEAINARYAGVFKRLAE